MADQAAKRFYKHVRVALQDHDFVVMLDERALKTPAKAAFPVPYQKLADAIRDEFDNQEDVISPHSMPVFSLAATVVDRVITQRATLDDELMRYGLNDLISYHCEADDDPVLAKRQSDAWGGIEAWLADRYDIHLQHFSGIMPQSQSAETGPALHNIISSFDDWRFVVLYRLTTLTGSLALSLAALDGKLSYDAFLSLAFLDELYQEEKWGKDELAIERRDAMSAEVKDALSYLSLLEQGKASR